MDCGAVDPLVTATQYFGVLQTQYTFHPEGFYESDYEDKCYVHFADFLNGMQEIRSKFLNVFTP